MLEVICMIISIGLMFYRDGGIHMTDDYTKILLGIGFIFLATVNRAIDVYKETHTYELDVTEDENGNLVVSKSKK